MSIPEATAGHPLLSLGAARGKAVRGIQVVVVVVVAAFVLKLLVALVSAVTLGFTLAPVATASASPADAETADPALEPLRDEVRKLESAVAGKMPRRTYIVIDRANNLLWLRRGDEIRLQAVVSTGSGTILKESSGAQRSWTFDTPPGRFQVLSERADPVWTKPDWAFLEEGQEPPESISERRERGSLGEWALDLGDGYMIHGTLYERLLGRSLTHGCIRVGRDDLRVVANTAAPGTPVYIF